MENWYKKAQIRHELPEGSVVEGPDMASLTPSKVQEIKRWLEEAHPEVNWTLEAVIEWVSDNFGGEPKAPAKPKDSLHSF